MYEISIIAGGRSAGKTNHIDALTDYLQSEEYKEMIQKLNNAGINVENHKEALRNLAKEFEKTTADISKLSECAALLNLRAKGNRQRNFVINHPNPVHRQYKRK